MRDAAALIAALSIMQDPANSRLAKRAALPRGMTFLLEVAAGEDEALEHARTVTGRSDDALRSAAGFFVEQVLLSRSASHYRVLGLTNDADARDLRKHMALLMKWVHPDASGHNAVDKTIDRSVFASRITEAWQTLKSEERRSAYDATLAADTAARVRRSVGRREQREQQAASPAGRFLHRILGRLRGSS
ncbi:MAG: DnaJ domain-containing protein [Hyphomicrobiaceae bacterium]